MAVAHDGSTRRNVFDPAGLVVRHNKRYPLFHAKDGVVSTTNGMGYEMVPFGTGVIDYVVKRYIHRNSAQDGASVGTIRAVGVVTRFLLMVIVVLIALKNLGFDITALVAGLGIGGVAVALAVQNILGDLFGALSIMVDKPFVIGDTIAVDDFVGSVENIGLKTTRIRSQTGEQLVFAGRPQHQARGR